MKKRICTILCLSAVAAASFAIAGCAEKSPADEYREKGYKISVTYDANGGKFIGQKGVKLMDMFNPNDYATQADGKKHIKLTLPTSPERPTITDDPVTIAKTEYSLVGWYKTRTLLKNENDEVVDDSGAVLSEKDGMYFSRLTGKDGAERAITVCDGVYYYAGEESDGAIVKKSGENKYVYERSGVEAKIAETVVPAYAYSDLWNFETDEIVYSETDDVVELTLYAGWVPYYQYHYYAKDENGVWQKYGETYFDYVLSTTNEQYSDQGEMYLPDWQGGEGAMNYSSHTYKDGKKKEFPSMSGKTFKAAYADEECTQPYTDKISHQGSIDLAAALPKNRIQNVYVEFYNEEMFKISKAEQLASNARLNGNYEIVADLDFGEKDKSGNDILWPSIFTSAEFTGKIYSAEGKTYTLKNITAKYFDTTEKGGLFGVIAQGAEVKNLRFENLTTDFVSAKYSGEDARYGLFCGEIDEEAKVENVTVSGAKLRLGLVSLQDGYKINLLANGVLTGLTQDGETALEVYGDAAADCYYYDFDEQSIVIDVAKKEIALTFLYNSLAQKRYSEYFTITWDDTGKTTATPGGETYTPEA